MKKIYLFLIGIMFCGVMTAQSQRFGDDILLHECGGAYWAKPKISVADNGWIYVLMNKHGHPTEQDSVVIYRSTDDGETFEKINYFYLFVDYKQGGFDLVVTGNEPSNISIWLLGAVNNTVTGDAGVYLYQLNADATVFNVVYKNEEYTGTIIKDVAISTNARSPEDDWAPFTMGFAVSYNTGSDRHIDYVYSTDGGATFTKKEMYTKANSEFGAIDLSIGQAKASSYYPMVGIVFEMDKESEENIGFIAAVANGNGVTNALQVNKKHSATYKTKQPKIQWLCNNAIDARYNFMIVYSSYYEGNDWDLVKIYPKSTYNTANHTLDNLSWDFVSASSAINEECPGLSYDKNLNNYLLVYCTIENDEYKLVYKVQYYEDLAGGEWLNMGDVSSTSTGYDWYYSPVVDINPSKNKACFAFEYYNGSENTTKLFFDSQWSTVDVENHEIVAKDMSVYPNPASNLINVISENANELITISDLSGKVVYSELASEKQNSIDISQLSAGMYIVRIGEKATKFVKE